MASSTSCVVPSHTRAFAARSADSAPRAARLSSTSAYFCVQNRGYRDPATHLAARAVLGESAEHVSDAVTARLFADQEACRTQRTVREQVSIGGAVRELD